MSETYDRMLQDLPPATYRRSARIAAGLEAQASEIDLLRDSLIGPDGAVWQFLTDTASWTLSRWEDELGLPDGTSLTDADRRNRLAARWTTFGTTTPERIHTIANAFGNGRVDVVEDFEHYTVNIMYIELFGVPASQEAMIDAIRVALPAHLAILAVNRYVTWDVFDDRAHTWDEFDALGYVWDDLPNSQV